MKLRSKSVTPAMVPTLPKHSRKTRIIQSDIQSIDTKVTKPSVRRYLIRFMFESNGHCVDSSFSTHLLFRIRTRSNLSSSEIVDLIDKTETIRNNTISAENGMLNKPNSISVTLSKDSNRTKKILRSNRIPPNEISVGTSTASTHIANDENNHDKNVRKNETLEISVNVSKDEICPKKKLRSENYLLIDQQQDNSATVPSTSYQIRYARF